MKKSTIASKRKLPSPITILMTVIIIAALATVIIPGGQYSRLSCTEGNSFKLITKDAELSLPFTQHTLDSLDIKISLEKFRSGAIRKPVSVPGTYQTIAKNRQGIIEILQAPIKGIYDSIDIVFFILIIGCFLNVFNESGAMVRGLTALSYSMKGKEAWLRFIYPLIIMLIIICAVCLSAGILYK